ncbi:hypothetical protein Pcinc_031452 [Petrolisthes cinctipes]|uniref:Uncharacterized protein n=1 Tax=Petrolisthes cinctipes TaxID=88211 RepID=A0AAE1K2L5_PETCI|nr:hypothetical protein Pcinc_031452 [Petrolisthes cinctipes]
MVVCARSDDQDDNDKIGSVNKKMRCLRRTNWPLSLWVGDSLRVGGWWRWLQFGSANFHLQNQPSLSRPFYPRSYHSFSLLLSFVLPPSLNPLNLLLFLCIPIPRPHSLLKLPTPFSLLFCPSPSPSSSKPLVSSPFLFPTPDPFTPCSQHPTPSPHAPNTRPLHPMLPTPDPFLVSEPTPYTTYSSTLPSTTPYSHTLYLLYTLFPIPDTLRIVHQSSLFHPAPRPLLPALLP